MNSHHKFLFLLLLIANTAIGQSLFTYTTFEGIINEYVTSKESTPIPNAQVEIHLDSYKPNKAKSICDCDNGAFSCSVNITRNQRVILVFKALGYASEIREFNSETKENGTFGYSKIETSLLRNDKTAGSKLADQNGEIKIFDEPKFDLNIESTHAFALDSVYINSIVVYKDSVEGRFLYYPNEMVDANGLWFKVTYQTDPNDFGGSKDGFVYFHFSEEFQTAKDKAYILAKSNIVSIDPVNKSNKDLLSVTRGAHYPVKDIDTKNNLLLLGGINKWIRNDQSRFILLSEREVLANNGKL